jgi:predicted GIY-YIG superfamily endonuclease
MILLFWLLTALLFLLALAFMVPWLKLYKFHLPIYVVMGCLSYSLYSMWGSSSLVAEYYSSLAQEKNDEQRVRLRVLFVELKKQEYRLRQHLEAFPKDYMAHSQLLELVAIESLQQGNKARAKHCLEAAIKEISNQKEGDKDLTNNFKERKRHLESMLNNL